ncbi:putative reverse transcriptase domain-containing protein [Tanacetum coccineum]
MPPRPMNQAAIDRLVAERVNAAVEAERERQANARRQGNNGAGGQGGAPAARECTFSGFMKCNPTVFHGHEGAVELIRWFEKTEMVFGISECAEARKVKFAAATLQGRALTWWNSQVAMMGLEAANQIGWTEMRRLMTEEFCPVEEVQRMEHELWNLKVKEFDITAYTKRFHELVQLCPEMVPSERKKIEAYIRGLTDNIKGTVIGSKPISLNEAVRMAHALMEQKSQARIERIAEGNKRKWESSQGGNNEPKKISEALEDESWVDAMQEELLQFEIQKVWVLVDLPYGKKAIGTKWVYRNKKDERGVVVRNKARLVAQGHRKEEGIDYDEVFNNPQVLSKYYFNNPQVLSKNLYYAFSNPLMQSVILSTPHQQLF